ncbi:MAG: glycogen debranching protein GlgX [Candidatus Hydrogenedentes bacterium]|nr:glycogen debranching protein GlgX [Candidatus Hydrogenedentota bacterium]
MNWSDLKFRPGRGRPFGATPDSSGVHFAVFSRNATRVWLALFDPEHPAAPAREIRLDREVYRLGDVWSVYVEGLQEGALYTYRMDGPHRANRGHLFDATQHLLDPYARGFSDDPATGKARCVVMPNQTGWFETRRPRVPMSRTIIYEMHIRGFTCAEEGGASRGGTYRDAIEKIPYLKELGITAVELLPVQACGEKDLPRTNPKTKEALTNYWGYNSIGFFAPNPRYSGDPSAHGAACEFRAMVDAFHQAGIEVILDVVYNHTSERHPPEPAQCFRGIDNSVYYILDENGRYRDLTGCGNTLSCNHPVVRDLILDSLRYWVTDMHVDGFRFDLASVLRRDRWGHMQYNGALIEHITEDPILREVKLIAEPWDLAGGYLVGAFGGEEWAEWNAQYRDDVRRFWRGDKGIKGNFALRITGSPDLYGDDGRTPLHSINFITAHDGFTLRDLVSFNKKHNELNGEDNRDGLDENFSWNCGVEGETSKPDVNALRLRMEKNYIATLFLSLGVPMLLGGDEFGRTQHGNNNAYCQDNPLSWFDWSLAGKNRELLEFCKRMIRFRQENPVLSRRSYFTGRPSKPGANADLLWFDAAGKPQSWTPEDPSIACMINGTENGGVDLYFMFNPTADLIAFTVPARPWRVRIDTAALAPRDIVEAADAHRLQAGNVMVLGKHSLRVLSCHPEA